MRTKQHLFCAITFSLLNMGVCLVVIPSGLLALVWSAIIASALLWLATSEPGEKIDPLDYHQTKNELKQSDQGYQKLHQLVFKLTPLWAGHIDLAREQIKGAIENLVVRFENLTNFMNTSISMQPENNEQDIFVTIENAEKGLIKITGALNKTQDFRAALQDEILLISSHAKELRAMATQVTKIAEQTNLLALNASIEAARAGENGRGFSVVADEVRKLSTESASTGKRISDTVKNVDNAIQHATEIAEKFSEEEKDIIRESRKIADDIVADFNKTSSALHSSVAEFREKHYAIKKDIDGVFINLQFQDRVDQIMNHIRQDLKELSSALTHAEKPATEKIPDSEEWLKKSQSRYTTLEQRDVHVFGKVKEQPAISQVTFF